jgi:hypothetical protein
MTAKAHIFIVVISCFAMVAPVVAQSEEEWTCDEGPHDIVNAAQAAFDEGDEDMAWTLAAHGEALCFDNLQRFRKAQALRRDIDRSNSSRYDTDAVPGKVDRVSTSCS